MHDSETPTLRKPIHPALKALAAVGIVFLATCIGLLLIILLVCGWPMQEQFVKAQSVSISTRLSGYSTSLADFEDGRTPNGCSVIASQDGDQVQLSITPEGDIAKVYYSIRVDDTDAATESIAAEVNAKLAELQNLVANSTDDVWTAVTRVQVPTKTLERGIAKGKPAGSTLTTGQGNVHIAYSFERWIGYTTVLVIVDSPIPITPSV